MSAERVANRLDVKHCLIKHDWRGSDTPIRLSDVASLKQFDASNTINCVLYEGYVELFTVKYDGTAKADRIIFPRTETEYSQLYRVSQGDIVISNIAATYGSVAIVPPHLDGLVVSKEYTVLLAKPGYDARVIWAVLRSPEIRAELLLRTTGANRTRIRWSDIKDIAFPYPDQKAVERFVKHIEDAEAARAKALHEQETATSELNDILSLDHDHARLILDAFKPPK